MFSVCVTLHHSYRCPCRITNIVTKGQSVHETLTHWGWVTHICVGKLANIGSDNYLNQCWNIVNWPLRNKLQWIFNRNSYIFIEENMFENVVCEMLFISSRPHWAVGYMDAILWNQFSFLFCWLSSPYLLIESIKTMPMEKENAIVLGALFETWK